MRVHLQFVFSRLAYFKGINRLDEPGGENADSVGNICIGRTFLDQRQGGLCYLHIGVQIGCGDREDKITMVSGPGNIGIDGNIGPHYGIKGIAGEKQIKWLCLIIGSAYVIEYHPVDRLRIKAVGI